MNAASLGNQLQCFALKSGFALMHRSTFSYTNLIVWDAKKYFHIFNNYVSDCVGPFHMVPELRFENVWREPYR